MKGIQFVLRQLRVGPRQPDLVVERGRFAAVLGILAAVVVADILGIDIVVDNHNLADFDPEINILKALQKKVSN